MHLFESICYATWGKEYIEVILTQKFCPEYRKWLLRWIPTLLLQTMIARKNIQSRKFSKKFSDIVEWTIG